ncbi:MAG TPA: hypothetical protein VGQ91_04525 [Ideonella sp.]|nr:hypothetical protein [Ideonella sp.]
MAQRALALAALLAAGASALAGPLAVRGPDNTRWVVNDDDDPALIERRLPNGALDPAFGRAGRATLDFGGTDVNVNALRVDTSGRIWVAGTTSGSGMSSAMVQRLQANGQADFNFAVGGRSSATPVGQRLMVVDMLPQADGSAWVAGNLIGPQGESDAGLWRLRPDGALDYGFGFGGVWKRPGGERSRALSLAAGPDGMIAFGVEALGRHAHREIYLVAPKDQPRLDPRPSGLTNDDDDEPFLVWIGIGFSWRQGPQTAELSGLPVLAANTRAASMPFAPSEAGHTALNPFTDPAPAASAPPAPEALGDSLPWGWLLGGVAALLALAFFWRRGASSGR